MLPDGIMSNLSTGYDQLWKAMIQPPRHNYHMEDLGPTTLHYDNGVFIRDDFFLESGTSGKMAVSFFRPEGVIDLHQTPCVVYLHSQGGCRLEGKFLIEQCLSQGLALCLFDFLGCGRSSGDYVSLGHFEQLQVERLIEKLTFTYNIGGVGLWGRSMGAVTAILYASKNASRVNSMVLDSPFSSLRKLVQDLAYEHFNLPSFISGIGISILSSSVESRLGVDLFEVLDPFLVVENCRTPVLFIVGSEDVMVRPKRVNQLCSRYGNMALPPPSKAVYECSGGHISTRDESTIIAGMQVLIREANVYIKVKGGLDRMFADLENKPRRNKKSRSKLQQPQQSNPFSRPNLQQNFANLATNWTGLPAQIISPAESQTSSFVSNSSFSVNIQRGPALPQPKRTGLLRSSTQQDGFTDKLSFNREGIAPGPRRQGLATQFQGFDARQRFRTKSFCDPEFVAQPLAEVGNFLSVHPNMTSSFSSKPGSSRHLNTSFVSQKGSMGEKAHDTSTTVGSHASFHEESQENSYIGASKRQLYKSKQNAHSGYITILPNFYFPN